MFLSPYEKYWASSLRLSWPLGGTDEVVFTKIYSYKAKSFYILLHIGSKQPSFVLEIFPIFKLDLAPRRSA
jgi:hypothetical protein